MRLFMGMLLCSALIACGNSDGDHTDSPSGASNSVGDFQVNDSFGSGFDSSSDRARIGWAYPDIVDLRARGWRLSVAANGLPDDGAGETVDLNRNNTRYTMTLKENGSSRRVNCLPDDPVQGLFERSELTENSISGRFEVTFVQCEDRAGKPTDVDGLPIIVSGEFSDLELTQQ